ncbi:(d)CMP kinase [Alphaproteobacteria bacterium]|nr:(d)CMP kinase [Alphaproteobacteria bacterium]
MENKLVRPIITIDGPAASGKGTITKRVADDFNLFYLETGLFYRVIAKLSLINSVKKNIKTFLNSVSKEAFFLANYPRHNLYNEEVAEKASSLAKLKEVRNFVLKRQLEILMDYPKEFKGIILEGRDCGTVIVPKADLKFFLTAKLEIRAKRRYDQLSINDKKIKYESVLRDLTIRDNNDTSRKISPLIKAKDAIEVDCSSVNIEETIIIVKKIILSKLPYFK